MNITLVGNASKWYRMFSQQALLTIASLSGFLLALPESTRVTPVFWLGGYSIQEILTSLTILAAVLGFIGRLIDQVSTKV